MLVQQLRHGLPREMYEGILGLLGPSFALDFVDAWLLSLRTWSRAARSHPCWQNPQDHLAFLREHADRWLERMSDFCLGVFSSQEDCLFVETLRARRSECGPALNTLLDVLGQAVPDLMAACSDAIRQTRLKKEQMQPGSAAKQEHVCTDMAASCTATSEPAALRRDLVKQILEPCPEECKAGCGR